MMNPEIKAAWVAALRSGDYEQGTGQLFDGDRYCCLGVLCDISNQGNWQTEDEGYISYLDEAEVTPTEVVAWAGLPEAVPNVSVTYDGAEGDVKSYFNGLAELNDGGYTFEEIAKLIEEQL